MAAVSFTNVPDGEAGRGQGNIVLDEPGALQPDSHGGTQIGDCEVFSRLVRKSPRTFIGFRLHPTEGDAVVLLRALHSRGKDAEPWLQENARQAAALRHPQIEHVYGIERDEEGSFWVSKFVPGASLSEVRAACKQKGMALPAGFVIATIVEAALGLQHIHSSGQSVGLVRQSAHGLLRPRSIIVNFAGKTQVLNPLFLEMPMRPSVEAEPLLGNAGYLSPEAIQGRPLDSRSDVFSLAVIFHELIADQPLIRGRTPREKAEATLQQKFPPPSGFNLTLPAAIDQVVLKALSLDPSQRFLNAGEFSKALKDAAGEFAWRTSQRAELMNRLFPVRAQHTQELEVLLQRAHDAKIERAAAKVRAEEEARAEEAARVAAEARATAERAAAERAAREEEARQKQAAVAAASAPAPRNATASRPAAPKSIQVSRSALVGAGIAVVVAFIAGAVLLGGRGDDAVSADPSAVSAGGAVGANPSTTNGAPVDGVPPGAADADGGAVAGVADASVGDGSDAGLTADADAGTDADAGEVDAGDAEKEEVKKKKRRRRRRDEVPLPPWLQ